MPTYKQRPHPKKKAEDLPLYRPMDRVALKIVENRGKIIPFVVAGLLILLLFAGYKAYSAHYENKAAALLNANEIERLAKDYERSKAAKIARLKLGKMALDTGEYDRAAAWYEPVASDPKAPAILRAAARQNLALSFLKKGDPAKAVEILENAANDPKNANGDYARLLLARVHETTGNKDKALEIYRSLSEGSTEPAVKTEAQERKKWLSETQPSSPSR